MSEDTKETQAETKPTEESIREALTEGRELSPEETNIALGKPEESVPLGEKVNSETSEAEQKEDKDTVSEDGSPKADTAKAEEKAEEVKDSIPDESFQDRLNSELSKPDGAEDLKGFSFKQKGVFYEAKKQRVRAQNAERELKKLQDDFKKQQELIEELRSGKEIEGAEDFITKGDVKKEIESTKEQTLTESAEKMKALQQEMNRLKISNFTQELSSRGYDDVKEVLDNAEAILSDDPDAMALIKSAAANGQNFVAVSYEQVKLSPKWAEIQAKKQASKNTVEVTENKKRAERIKENATKAPGS